MILSSSGLVTWDVSDNDSLTEGSKYLAVMMVEDLDSNGSVKSYIPLDFVFKITERDQMTRLKFTQSSHKEHKPFHSETQKPSQSNPQTIAESLQLLLY